MPLITVVIVLVVVGFLLWFVETQQFIPLDATIRRIIQIVVVLAVILWLLQIFGVWQYVNAIKI